MAICWQWEEPKRQRKLHTVGDYIFWSYSMLSVSREIMERTRKGEPSPHPNGRTKAANILMSHFQGSQKKIRDLDRDDRLSQDGAHVCAHFGCLSSKYHWDHMVPRSKLYGLYIPLNQVRSCPRCNISRGAKDLMGWHRENQTFPSLGILRRYLKICYYYSQQHGYLDLSVENAVLERLPFEPRNFPRKFPSLEQLVWDYAYKGPQA